MKRRISVLLTVSIFCILAAFAEAFAQNNFLWRIQSRNSTVYALGSIHLLKPDLYPLNKTIENAFAKSGSLAVEANVNNINVNNMQNLVERGLYSDGDSLITHVSEETLELLNRETDRAGLPTQVFYKQKPWLLALTLQSLELIAVGYKPEYGIDQHFLSKAGGKKIIELESIDYQLNLLSGFSDSEQELFLLYTLRDLRTLVKEADNMVEAWKSGNVKLMDSIMKESAFGDNRLDPIYDKLIIQRNKKMASKIEGFLKGKGTCFVVVGAAHLLGERGIIQLLRDKGYSVDQM